MNFQELRACIVKELRLLGRDVHGLALLFVMPAAFILIMSLALKVHYFHRDHFSGTNFKLIFERERHDQDKRGGHDKQ